jgi:Icc protein
MTNKKFRVVQLSDLHLYADQEKTLLGVNTYQSFSATLDLLKKDSTPPDLILLTGDLAQDNSELAYQAVKDAFNSFSTPIHYIPGNHDDISLMTRVLPSANFSSLKQIILGPWQFILLNSQKPHAVEGYIDDAQFNFLENCLQMYPHHHAIIVFHHQPVPVGVTWLDKIGLTNADKLWETLARYPHVHTLLFGHVHQAHVGEKNGIPYYSTPSTCIQFKRNCVDFALEELPPAYRWIDLYPNGDLKTDICRTSHYMGVFDANAKGY